MSRKQFIQSHGASCRNWTWSWSFVNHADRIVIFGAWDKDTAGGRAMILDESWSGVGSGRRNPGFFEAREYLRLVEAEGYELRTFPMVFSLAQPHAEGGGPAKIKSFRRELTTKSLVRVGARWYACDDEPMPPVAEELELDAMYSEGARQTIAINAYERNRAARAACLQYHGARCIVCGFTGRDRYGVLGAGVIHVHHLVPVAEMKREYTLDAVRDLVPVCPNCHAVIHSTRPALTLDQVRAVLVRDVDA